jgi:DNA-binding NarL/FixJ family response regulator
MLMRNQLSRLLLADSSAENGMVLRPREWDVLHLLAIGATNAEIADRLSLAEGTVRNVVARLTVKLGVVDRTQAALLASHAGLGRQYRDVAS